MNESRSDALVFFGASGVLADKKIFTALQAMVKRGCFRSRGWLYHREAGIILS